MARKAAPRRGEPRKLARKIAKAEITSPAVAKFKVSKWKTVASREVYTTPIFGLHRYQRHHDKLGPHDFFVLEAPDWVNIIPLTERNEVVMVRQFRHGIEGFTLEIPGGMVDPEDRSPRHAARREMWEETGYDSADLVALGKVHPNPAIQGNRCYTYLARGVRLGDKPMLGGSEETQVVLVPLKSVGNLIASGRISHALVIAAFSFFHVYNPPARRAKPVSRARRQNA